MKKGFNTYYKLFSSMFYLSTFTFGGGYVIVPLMKKKFVEELKLIDDDEMLDLVSIGQSAPGAVAINTSILIGYKVAGIKGALVSIMGTVLPPFMIISLVSMFYVAFKENVIVITLLKSMRPGVAAVIIGVVVNMILDIFKRKDFFSIIIMTLAFIFGYVFKVNVVYIILACALIGVLITFFKIRKVGANN